MNGRLLAFAGGALLTLGVAGAQAGPCTSEIENFSKTLAAHDAGSGPTPGATASGRQTGTQTGQHPPTAAMSGETTGRAASPSDVQRQTAGQPTAAEQGRGGAQAGGDSAGAMAALERAKALDQQNDAGCMKALDEAKQHSSAK